MSGFRTFLAGGSPGNIPVVLSIANTAIDQHVKFASRHFKQSDPINWEMMTIGDQGEIFGYPVDSGTGCFMDRSAHLSLNEKTRANPNYYETMLAEMEKTYTRTWSWLNFKFDDENLIAFSSGYGDGVFATYAGYDAEGKLSKVVTDFSVLED